MRTQQIGALLALAVALAATPAAAQVCGDGFVTPPELCDDGNLAPGDGCSPLCLPENLPPDCTGAFASVEDLWPPNHKLVPVTVDGVVDPDGDPVALLVTAVAQDEPVDDVGDGSTCPDAVGVGTDVVELRSERQGPGDGRVYHVDFAATDPFGAACVGTVVVCVRHDNRPGGTCGDGGPLYDSALGDPLACGQPECDIDACIPDDDELGGCSTDLPRAVLRKTSRARVVLARAADASRPARRSRLGKRAVRLLTRAEARASVALDAACGDFVAGVLTAARDCAACATDVP
jgi:cysteine-rich repeat protein